MKERNYCLQYQKKKEIKVSFHIPVFKNLGVFLIRLGSVPYTLGIDFVKSDNFGKLQVRYARTSFSVGSLSKNTLKEVSSII